MALVRGSRVSSTNLLAAALLVAGCSHPKSATEGPAADARTSTEPASTYIPENLEDALADLDRILAADVREEMRAGSEDDMIEYHHGLGTWMRNEWGLWARSSQLSAYFQGLEIHHPDDMSGIILDSYWRRLHGLDLELDAQVSRYREYWENNREPEDKLCPRDRSVLAIHMWLDDVSPAGKSRTLHVGTCEQGHTMIYERGGDWREPTQSEWLRIGKDEGGTVSIIDR